MSHGIRQRFRWDNWRDADLSQMSKADLRARRSMLLRARKTLLADRRAVQDREQELAVWDRRLRYLLARVENAR